MPFSPTYAILFHKNWKRSGKIAHYKATFQGKTEAFTIRNAVGEDAPAILDYMARVDRETTFLAREAGEFEKTIL